jgi:DNA-binding MarR family transcriptional regulator
LAKGIEKRMARPATQLGALIHDCARIRRTVIDKALKPIGITRAQRWVLIALAGFDDRGVSQKELADEMGIGQVAIGERLAYLETMGCIERVIDARDRRQRVIVLTGHGREILARSWDLSDGVNRTIFEGVSAAEVEAARSVLSRLRANLIRAGQELG